ncbi:MAG: radical SAM protein [Desulfobacteraceae bacterium]|nr:radical SAM protein [Desulfobacteraceae bacterium]
MAVNGSNAPIREDSERDADRVTPGYVGLLESGELARRAEALRARLDACDLCPRSCGVNRNAGKKGYCGVDGRPRIASAAIHPWEEPPISGTKGSGTIFFSGCTLKCVFCQNYPISQLDVGRTIGTEELASSMLSLQKKGAHNINLVTSAHQSAAVVEALLHAVPMGLTIPLLYNSSGYESLETLKLLEGVIDIYLPDIKYSDATAARLYSGASDYVAVNRAALREMWRQVGPLRIGSDSIARKGMLVRHMVLPEDLSGTKECLRFLVSEFGPDVWISLMNQYFPAHKGLSTPPLDRKVSEAEYEEAFNFLTDLRIVNGFVQDAGSDR